MNKSIARMINLLARKSQSYIGNALCKYNLTAAEQPFFMALQHYEGVDCGRAEVMCAPRKCEDYMLLIMHFYL